MKTIKLIEQNWILSIASYWTKYDVTDEEYNKIVSWLYNVSLVDLVFTFTDNAEAQNASINQEITTKMKRLYDIDTELRKLNAPWITITKPSLIALNETKIAELNIEAEQIQTDISENYESTLVDDIYTSLFL